MIARPFTSARLAMRPLQRGDAEALHVAYSDPVLMRYWSRGPIVTLAETRDYVAAQFRHPEWRGWAITMRRGDTPIGTLATTLRREGVSEIGYLLVRSAWGQGYAREAVATLLDRLFDDEGMRRVYADVDPDNAASITLLEALGFQREGVLRAEWDTHIGVRDSLILGLLANERVSSSASTHA